MNRNSEKEFKKSEEYFNHFNLVFSGIIYDKEYFDHGQGIIRINVSQTNKTHYDVRDSLSRYYCTIKEGKAELKATPYDLLNIGDSIYVNGPLRLFKLFRKDSLIIEHELYGLTGPQEGWNRFRSMQKL